jgi:site-specific recombinase XerD
MQLQAALQAFLLQLEADGRSVHTRSQYRRHCMALATWLATTGASTTVADLTPDLLARFFAGSAAKESCRGGPKRATSLNAMRTSIRCFAQHLHQSGLIANNPARLLRRARCAPPPPRALHVDEERRLLGVLAAATGPEAARDRMLVDLLLGCGARIGSVLALDVEDLDLQHCELRIRKAKNDRPCSVLLPKAIAEKLAAFVSTRPTGPLFMAGDRRLSVRHAQRRLAGWLAAAKVTGKSAHSLRHTFATTLLARTGDLRMVQLALNHQSIVSTTCYATVDRARLRAVVGA